MRSISLAAFLLLGVAVCQAVPTPKVLQKKSLIDETNVEKKENIKIEEVGDEKDRAKKSATTFCVQFQPGSSQAIQTPCACNNCAQQNSLSPSQTIYVQPANPSSRPEPVQEAEAEVEPMPTPAPQPRPQPQPEPQPQPQPQPQQQQQQQQQQQPRPPCNFNLIQPVRPQTAHMMSIVQPLAPIHEAFDAMSPPCNDAHIVMVPSNPVVLIPEEESPGPAAVIQVASSDPCPQHSSIVAGHPVTVAECTCRGQAAVPTMGTIEQPMFRSPHKAYHAAPMMMYDSMPGIAAKPSLMTRCSPRTMPLVEAMDESKMKTMGGTAATVIKVGPGRHHHHHHDGAYTTHIYHSASPYSSVGLPTYAAYPAAYTPVPVAVPSKTSSTGGAGVYINAFPQMGAGSIATSVFRESGSDMPMMQPDSMTMQPGFEAGDLMRSATENGYRSPSQKVPRDAGVDNVDSERETDPARPLDDLPEAFAGGSRSGRTDRDTAPDDRNGHAAQPDNVVNL